MTAASSNKLNRRSFALGGVAAVAAGTLGFAGVAAAQQATPSAGGNNLPDLKDFSYLWSSAPLPTHQGDTYTVVLKNTGTTAQKIYVRAVVVDRQAKDRTPLVSEEVTLDPGAEKTYTGKNDGTANGFVTRLLTETDSGLNVDVTVKDSAGQTTATFTQGAFWVQSRDELRTQLKGTQKQRRKLRRRLRRHGRL
jgi:hypothetical protein